MFKSFVAWQTDWRTKYLQSRCSIMRGICTKRNWRDISIRGRENYVPPKPDIHTDMYTEGRHSVYRVASLLKKNIATHTWGLTLLVPKFPTRAILVPPFLCRQLIDNLSIKINGKVPYSKFLKFSSNVCLMTTCKIHIVMRC